MKTQPTSEERAHVRRVLQDAANDGADPVRALLRADLVLFGERKNLLIRQALDQLADMIDEMTVKQMAEFLERRMPTSPLDMKRYIVELIRHTTAGLKG